ncbi:hypothetical protein L1987_61233 [Smallanthus sonchifolius]|uniref:Uncharacterized protein n=1 Tax=Smallanthus sonchifolius TaxID=185202 RepID=A0ACB9DAW0_9ASTR|nr:hypothetical protein L1987_61233 [Smallanthus sonchifolius]
MALIPSSVTPRQGGNARRDVHWFPKHMITANTYIFSQHLVRYENSSELLPNGADEQVDFCLNLDFDLKENGEIAVRGMRKIESEGEVLTEEVWSSSEFE